MSVSKNGHAIRTLDEWREIAPPKKDNHWSPGRSAMEAANYWLSVSSPVLPLGIIAALNSHKVFGAVKSWCAEPEVCSPFDQLQGEPQNTDLLVKAYDGYAKSKE